MPPGSVVFRSWWVGHIYFDMSVLLIYQKKCKTWLYIYVYAFSLFSWHLRACNICEVTLKTHHLHANAGDFHCYQSSSPPLLGHSMQTSCDQQKVGGWSDLWAPGKPVKSKSTFWDVDLHQVLRMPMCCWTSLKATGTAKRDCKWPYVMICLVINFFLVSNQVSSW